jgi:hypothetical protein
VALEILPVELRRNMDELRGTCAGRELYRANGWKGALWDYNIRHHSRNRTMYEWSERSCLDYLHFSAQTTPVSLPEQNQNPVVSFWQLRLKQADGVGHAVCLDDWLVVFCCLDLSDSKEDSKSLFDEIRFIAHFLGIISLSCRSC